MGKVLTDIVVNFDPEFGELAVQHLFNQRRTTTASCGSFGGFLDATEGGHTGLYRTTDGAFGDVETGADLRGVWQCIYAHHRAGAAFAYRQNKLLGCGG